MIRLCPPDDCARGAEERQNVASGSRYTGHPCPHPSLGRPQSRHSPEGPPVVRTRETAFLPQV